ncbi:nicotinamide riboside transporter PnuC [Niallia oryzisoli]|uniref:Nicotinamide riboside transporter PnuC n=1 Tax=Niallia oryzisoli TaxID=1737571 RepID=A0ABZ2CQK5_9BACI
MIKQAFSNWTLFEKSWLVIFTAINLYLFYAWQDSVLGLITSLSGMLCVVLVAKGKIFNYYPGILNILLYAYLSYQQGFYGEVALNILYFLPMQLIGLLLWQKHQSDKQNISDVAVSMLNKKLKFIWGMIIVAATVLLGFVLQKMGGAQPYVDASTTILQVAAQFFMIKRLVEQWITWIIVDMVSIWMWLTAFLTTGNDVTVLIMWIAYLFNAIYGYVNWK